MLVCAAALPAAAQWLPLPEVRSFAMPARADDTNPIALGRRAEMQDDLPAAAGHYEAALTSTMAQIAQDPAAFKPMGNEQLRTVLPHYGRVMMMLGRLPEAEVALEHLMAIPQPPPAARGGMGFDAVRQVLNALGSVGAQAAAGMNQRLLIEGDAARPLETALRARLPPTDVPSALMAELRARQGRTSDVLALWQHPFQDDIRSLLRNDGAQFLTADNVVAAAWRMALALQAVGAHAQAQQAARLALEQDRQRIRHWAGEAALLDVQLGGMLQHRQLAALSVQGALNTLSQKADATSAMQLALGAVAISKGLPLRYAMRRRALLAALEDFRPSPARIGIDRLETELLQISTDGDTGVRAWADWANRYAAAWQPLMPQLKRAGLPLVVAEPDALLKNMTSGLATGEALVGFVLHEPLSLSAPATASPRLVRYTLDASGISLRDLGSRREIERLVAAWRVAGDAARQQAIGRQLTARLLSDLPAPVRAAKRWVIDPEGMLALLPFEALPDEDGTVLLERRTLRYVTSMAQLAEQRQETSLRDGATALVLADPAYAPPDNTPGNGSPIQPPHARTTGDGRLGRGMVFTPLPDTRSEGEAVKASLQASGLTVQLLMGPYAQPQALRNANAPTYLHVASHAFVVPATPEADSVSQKVRMVVPGLLAGLALAPDDRGMVLSGSELATLNLRNTRLVVLSACDTGNGNLDVHDGLTSLRRAAEEAGARATVTSLWPVPSASTTRLMTLFYQQLSTGLGHAEALRQAKLILQQQGATSREWAGFILAGADR